MRMIFPPIFKCRRMYNLLYDFHVENKNNYTIENKTRFNHAVMLFCDFYKVPMPKRIRFRRSFGHEKCIGICYDSGNIDLLYPIHFYGTTHSWIGVVYHELYHYVYHCKEEQQTIEFEKRMLERK